MGTLIVLDHAIAQPDHPSVTTRDQQQLPWLPGILLYAPWQADSRIKMEALALALPAP